MKDFERWRRDPIAFISEVLCDPDNDAKAFVLYREEEQFLRQALTLTPDGNLPYPELLFSAPKKSGKTALAAMAMLYVIVCLGGQYAEGYALANDLEQSTGRVFAACTRIIECSPLLKDTAKITATKIEFLSTGATIQAIASDYAGAAGPNPNFVVFDELWGYTSERSRRLWDEMVPPPTRRVAARLTVSYAGFEGESVLLDELHQRGLQGEQMGIDRERFCFDGMVRRVRGFEPASDDFGSETTRMGRRGRLDEARFDRHCRV